MSLVKRMTESLTESLNEGPKYQPPGDTKVTCMVDWRTKHKKLEDYKEVPKKFDLEIKDFRETGYPNDYELKLYGTIDNLIRYLQYSKNNGFEVSYYDRIKPDKGRMLYLVSDYYSDRYWASVYSPRSEKCEWKINW